MSWFTNIFSKLFGWIHSNKGQAIAKVIEDLTPTALLIVTQISKGTPNRTVDEINKIATSYGLPTIAALESTANGTDVANVLANLAMNILSQYAPAGTSRTIIETVIRLALLELKNA